MENKALGLIEVRGLLGAIEVADIALKTANVHLLNKEVIKGGLTTIQVIGDVGAVKASVDAGEEAAKRLGCYLSSHVIPRVDDQTFKILADKNVNSFSKQEDNSSIEESLLEENMSEETVLHENEKKENPIDYENIKLSELKKIAYQLEISDVPKDKIKKGSRNELIEIIKNFSDSKETLL